MAEQHHSPRRPNPVMSHLEPVDLGPDALISGPEGPWANSPLNAPPEAQLERAWAIYGAAAQRLAALEAELVATQSEAERLRRAAQEFNEQSFLDPKSGLPNKVALISALQVPVTGVHPSSFVRVVIHIDLDKFKVINHALGHNPVDDMLTFMLKPYAQRSVGDDLSAGPFGIDRPVIRIGSNETLYRTGGDEFVILVEVEPKNAHLIGLRVKDQLLQRALHYLTFILRAPGHISEAKYDAVEAVLDASFGIALESEGHADMVLAADVRGEASKRCYWALPKEIRKGNPTTTELLEALAKLPGEVLEEAADLLEYPPPYLQKATGVARFDNPSDALLGKIAELEAARRVVDHLSIVDALPGTGRDRLAQSILPALKQLGRQHRAENPNVLSPRQVQVLESASGDLSLAIA